MPERIVVPFGPQHPVLPEPIHLDLVLEDETVVEAVPSIGYIHRGLEQLVQKREFPEYVYVAERICGICSFMHALCYCQGVEHIMGIEVPDRARYLRTIWSECSRLHSHLLWLGLFADAMGFENLFMRSWQLRESVLDVLEDTTGGRVIQGTCKIGGVRRDIEPEKLGEMHRALDSFEEKCRDLTDVFLNDETVKYRLRGLGVVGKDAAYALGAVGPTVRASGVRVDLRETGYAAYGDLDFRPVVETTGDCYARCAVRAGELFTSIDLIRQAIDAMPDGPLDVKVKGMPDGEYFSRVEQPRGEVVHYLRGNGTKHLVRSRIRTPTLANIPMLVKMLPGAQLADVPVVVLSIDPCISCTER
ncbi:MULTISPECIES: nickel-dependent hydrogenase large subunit [unclassified Methanoculleus]|jgi:Ni,Fe-hydrogenase III large subunit|uniref:hydrogenase large subunit n=1 Tax=unclassified Methanoculleus TaxID=2619537 RepID=UPI0025E7A14D|nr:nickel-dependent hydrogenase large subunit [Methanoculleus sp. UBA377]MDD2472563.1 nickel-dependent hydrogenase large subunit [Methanoculleus sp.]